MRGISQRDFGQLVLSYLTNVLLFAVVLLVYRTSRYYVNFLSPQTQKTLLVFFGVYLVAAIPLELLLPPERRRLEGKGLIALRAVLRSVQSGWKYLRRYPLDLSHPPILSKREKTAILFLLVKIFFLPVMINFMFGNWANMMESWGKAGSAADSNALLLGAVFPFLTALVFFIDTIYFTFGYAVEYPVIGNEVRSVEPTFFGWVIALICYPPFNGLMDNYLVWTADGNATAASLFATYVIRIVALGFLWLYLWPTFALGTRASNLTNRGIVTWGPYAYIRHPAYVGKTFGWWVTSIPFLLEPGKFLVGALSMTVWMLIYFFRALTEERHLSADPEYQEYCRKVPWRFIPYVL
ncbi:MAG: isoprenylcysteine carboxylmethyltransferase family protein [Candidatus Peribacteraceae bacterium]